MMIGMGKNMMMDMESGDIHFTIGSNDQSDEDNDWTISKFENKSIHRDALVY